jgi:Nif-specific regulatory protein
MHPTGDLPAAGAPEVITGLTPTSNNTRRYTVSQPTAAPAVSAESADSPSDRLGLRLLAAAADGMRLSDFHAAAAPIVREALDLSAALIIEGTKGQWRVRGGSVGTAPLPVDLLAEALDRHEPIARQGWSIVHLSARPDNRHLLAAKAGPAAPPSKAQLAAAAHYLDTLGQLVAQRNRAQSRADRLHSMIEMTTRWNQSRETEQLLIDMARTSTQLLEAQRATIFLWDKANRQLIGKPALGVAGGEIRVPENAGVVGQVIASGEPLRVDADVAPEQAQIHRDIDRKLGFQTRSLLCVPLFDADRRVIGAFELINKSTGSFSDDDQEALVELAASAAVAISNTRHVQHLVRSRRQIADQAAQRVQMVGQSSKLDELRSAIERVARTDLAVLILGENGTGKEVIAQLIHYHSPRRDHVLVSVNCAAITETLLESELFGHEKGAFTDAHEARPGKFEIAHGGTLLLDEIGDMSLGGQAKLLRVLEEKIVVRVGGSKPIPTDVRVLAATNQDLGQLVRDKKFREDLFFRLNVVALKLPPLRERGDDVLMLARHFLTEFCARSRRDVPRFSAAAETALLQHPWPGNVRELRNVMERIAYLHDGPSIEPLDLSLTSSPQSADSDLLSLSHPLADATAEFQRQFIQRRIKQARGNMTDAAEKLGLHRSNLYRKMRQLGMVVDDERNQ